MKVLMIAEHDNSTLKPVNTHTLTAALQLGETDILVIGHQGKSVAEAAAALPSVQRVLVADAIDYAHQMAENVASLIADIAHDYQAVVMAATTTGKNVLPRVAGLLQVAMIADVVKIISPDTFVRPIYAGNALATVQISENIKLLTVRSTAFQAQKMEGGQKAVIEKINKLFPNTSEFKKQELTASTRPELTAARVIVSGGRGS